MYLTTKVLTLEFSMPLEMLELSFVCTLITEGTCVIFYGCLYSMCVLYLDLESVH